MVFRAGLFRDSVASERLRKRTMFNVYGSNQKQIIFLLLAIVKTILELGCIRLNISYLLSHTIVIGLKTWDGQK